MAYLTTGGDVFTCCHSEITSRHQKIYSIKDIYHQASILLNITEESLRSTIMNSFKNNFTIEANL